MMKWKTNGVDFSIWVLCESFTYLYGDADVCANKQNSVCPMLFLPRVCSLSPSLVYRGSERRSVASLPSAREGNEILCTLYYKEDEKSDY